MADKYFHQRLIPAAATETTIYTAPAANTAIIKSLRVTNASGNQSDITVSQYETSGGAVGYLYHEQALAHSASVDVFAGVPCILEESNVLKVTSTRADVTFYLSYLEVDRD